jgi:hypothetical protein
MTISWEWQLKAPKMLRGFLAQALIMQSLATQSNTMGPVRFAWLRLAQPLQRLSFALQTPMGELLLLELASELFFESLKTLVGQVRRCEHWSLILSILTSFHGRTFEKRSLITWLLLFPVNSILTFQVRKRPKI